MPINPSPAVLRACDLLEHLAARPGEAFSVSELAREVGIPRATCDAVLLALAERSLVDRREPDRRYSLGPACISIGEAARAGGSLVAPIVPLADAFARETGTCVALATLSGKELRVERAFDHGPAFGARARVGDAVPLIAPFGAVFVAWAPERVDAWLDGAGVEGEDRDQLRAALAAIRARGLSIAVPNTRSDFTQVLDRLRPEPGRAQPLAQRDAAVAELAHSEELPVELDEEQSTRVNHLSAPVFGRSGEVVVQIMVLAPPYDLSPAEIRALGDRVMEVARIATERVGGAVAPRP